MGYVKQVLLLVVPAVLLGCAAGTPPPGPIDIIREIVDPNYDYRDSPDTWRDSDARDRYRRDSGGWSAQCSSRDLTCSHDGATICCAPSDRCCAGRTGPFCCDGEYAGRGGYDD